MPKIASRPRPWTAICLTALSLSSVGLAACGGSSSTTSSSANTSPSTTASPAKSATTTTGTPANKAQAQQQSLAEALRKRSSKAATTPNASTNVKTTSSRAVNSFKNALSAFTACLRKNGVSIPAASGKGSLPALAGVKTNTPQFRAATAKCRAALLASLRKARLPVGAR